MGKPAGMTGGDHGELGGMTKRDDGKDAGMTRGSLREWRTRTSGSLWGTFYENAWASGRRWIVLVIPAG